MPDINDDVAIKDEVKVEKAVAPGTVERKPYKVLTEAGLFKNGKHYKTGSTVELDEATAANFIAIGDVEAT